MGANPAAMSSVLRSRSGISSSSARCNSISRLGCARPVSTNEKCRAEISALRASLWRAGAWVIVAGNALWVLASAALLVAIAPTALGYAFVIGQGVVVAL